MRKSKITALAFLISGVLLIICCFLPLKTMVIESSFLNETEIIRFMPSFGGFLILILALGCVIFPIVGYKQQSAMVGTISALVGGGLLWYYSANAGRAALTNRMSARRNETIFLTFMVPDPFTWNDSVN